LIIVSWERAGKEKMETLRSGAIGNEVLIFLFQWTMLISNAPIPVEKTAEVDVKSSWH